MSEINPVKEDISDEVLNLLTEEEKENLQNFNSKGIKIKSITPTEKVEFLEEATEADESDEEDTEVLDDFEENDSVNSSFSTSNNSDSDILKNTNQDFSDLFSDF